MNVRHTLLTCAGVLGFTGCSESSAGPSHLPSCGAHGTQLSLAVGAYTSINPASDSGCVTFAANTSPDTAEYLVLPWSGGGTPGSSAPFTLQSAAPAASISLSRLAPAPAGTRGATPLAFDHFLRELARSRRYPQADRSVPRPSPAAGPPTVGSARSFKVCANPSCSTTVNVGAVARAVGVHIAIYIDTLAPSPGLSASDLDSLKNVFDTRLYPLDTVTFGHVSDIDSNTVVIVLMSNQVNKLVTTAQCNSSGYIAGFFFPGDLEPGFSTNYNNGEVFYSIVADSTGTLSCAHKNSDVNRVTPVTFTHEFQHMINFAEHVLVKNGNYEDGWLDEGLSKYAEEIAGRSFGDVGDGRGELALHPLYRGSVRGFVAGPAGPDSVDRSRKRCGTDRPALRPDDKPLGARQLGVGSAGILGAECAAVHVVALPQHVQLTPQPGSDGLSARVSVGTDIVGGECGQ